VSPSSCIRAWEWHYKVTGSDRYNLRRVTGQNGIGQNGTDKMVWTKWYRQNGSNFYRFQFN